MNLPRRLRSYSLRTLLVLLTVFCVWLGGHLDRVLQQRRVVEWVEAHGGVARYDYQQEYSFCGVLYDKPGPDWLGDDWFADVVYVSLRDTSVDDVAPISVLSRLERLELSGTLVSNLTPLSGMRTLERLDVSGSQVCDLTPLSRLSGLQWLNVSGSEVSDVTSLTQLKDLRFVNLSDTKVDDLTPLTKLPRLAEIWLNGTNVDRAEIYSFIASLDSYCNIHWDWGMRPAFHP